jgi:LysM repeat protein
LGGSTIGIKIADGSYYPVLEEGSTGKKKLVLTTVKDNQSKVQIDLYRGDGDTLEKAQYIGSLIIENITPAPRGNPDIELSIGLDAAGELSAEASDRSTGESQSFSIGLQTLTAEETYEIPEFEMEGDTVKTTIASEEAPLTGESYPVGDRDRRKEHFERKGPNTFLIILFIVLGLALLGAIGYFVYTRVISAAPQQAAQQAEPPAATTLEPAAATPEPAATTVEQPVDTTPAATEPVTQAQSQEGGVAVAPKPSSTTAPATGVKYRIKKGDTLWDISATYYRNPWLYPKLAKANNIKNPDLIFADTTIFIPEE